MSGLAWLQTMLSRTCPERADQLAAVVLNSDDAQSWQRLCRAMQYDSDELFEFVKTHTHTPCADLKGTSNLKGELLKESIARRYSVVCCGEENNTLILACSRPFDDALSQELAFNLGHKVDLRFAPPEAIDNAINIIYSLQDDENSRSVWISDDKLSRAATPDEAIERIVDLVLDEAVKKNASDIHVQSFLGGGLVRYRVDGQLIRGPSLPKKVQESVLRYIINRAHLDVSNHSTPQDGRIQMNINGQAYDLRISILPSHDARRLVIRLLNQSRDFSMSALGFPLAEQHALERLSQESRGLILFTGPTGSGKTTSLYTLLSSINTPELNIMTAEDPVEYRIPGLSQIEVDEGRGRGFDSILKSMLRQDPDIILIGEIRDAKTLKIALQAVMTGHLVFATLHTSDIPGTIRRLLDLGATQGQLAEGIKGIIGQRMARKLCKLCAEPVDVPNHIEQLFFDTSHEKPAMRAVGCEACNYSGYKQRFPLIEVYEPSQHDIELLRQERFLLSPLSTQDRSMNVIATEAVISGVTSIEEITRVLGADYWREFNSLVMQDALVHMRKGLKDKREVCVMLIGATDAIAEQVKESLQYPVAVVEDAKDAVIELQSNSGVFAQFIFLKKSIPLSVQIAELRRGLASSGLPTAFIVEEMVPEVDALFTQHKVSHWISLPIDTKQIQKLAADLMEV